jgi:hypothetical protein
MRRSRRTGAFDQTTFGPGVSIGRLDPMGAPLILSKIRRIDWRMPLENNAGHESIPCSLLAGGVQPGSSSAGPV